jgi:signal transduction histidine kinase
MSGLDRLRRPKTAVRWRLTLLYGGLFMACGAVLLVVTYALVSHATVNPGAESFYLKGKAVPAGAQIRHEGVSREVHATPRTFAQLPANIQRALKTPGGQDAIRFVGNQQRVADLHQLEVESAIALAIMALISGGLGWMVAGRVLRPLERAYDAQRRFVANASHELRTPLTASRALLEMVVTDPTATTDEFRETCRDALEENEQQEQLIDALLALAEGEQGLGRREPVDLAVVARDALCTHEIESLAEDLHFDVALASAPVVGDRRLLARLVSNLVQNAIRHNVPHGYARVLVGSRDGRAVLRIVNSGPVVPAAEIERLLTPFQRLAPDRLGHAGGFGLGLSIVAAVAAAHDAALDIAPADGGGLRVEVRFPLSGMVIEPPHIPDQKRRKRDERAKYAGADQRGAQPHGRTDRSRQRVGNRQQADRNEPVQA